MESLNNKPIPDATLVLDSDGVSIIHDKERLMVQGDCYFYGDDLLQLSFMPSNNQDCEVCLEPNRLTAEKVSFQYVGSGRLSYIDASNAAKNLPLAALTYGVGLSSDTIIQDELDEDIRTFLKVSWLDGIDNDIDRRN